MVPSLAQAGEKTETRGVAMNSNSATDLEELPHPVFLSLEAAEGWLLLNNSVEALAELETVPAEYRTLPKALAVEWKAADGSGQPDRACSAAQKLCELMPECGTAWICQANSLCQVKGAQAAADLLLTVVPRFYEEPILAYNLACYLAQAGDIDTAAAWLLHSFENDSNGQLKGIALVDPDLKPLWERIGEHYSVRFSDLTS